MGEINRFNLDSETGVTISATGDFVEYSEYRAIVDDLEEEIKSLRADLYEYSW
jgi:hypothetical protein